MQTITKAFIRYYRDNGQYQASVHWSDGSTTSGMVKRKPSCFLMRPSSFVLGSHLEALFARAQREGLTIGKEIW